MIKKHECSGLVKTMTTDELREALSQASSLANSLVEILKACQAYQDGSMDDDSVLDVIDDYHAVNLHELSTFSACYCSKVDAINNYLADTLNEWAWVHTELAKASSKCLVPERSEMQKLCDGLKRVVAGAVYFIMHEFGLFDLMRSDDKDPAIDEIFKAWIDLNCEDVDNTVAYYCVLYDKFKMRLEVFDEYPEKEMPFEILIGPYYASVDSKKLTVEIVDGLLEGKLTPEDVCTLTGSEENDGQ